MRRTVLTAAVLLAAGVPVLPASAEPKPITKTYTATAAPSVIGMVEYCDGLPTTTDKHFEPFAAPAKGTLKVKMTGVTGDWDLFLIDAGGATIAESATLGPGDETYSYKVRSKSDLQIMTCNAIGGPTAEVSYTFTFAK